MVGELSEQHLAQAKFLVVLWASQAGLRRAVSAAYYGLFHSLVRQTALKWNGPLHHARIARIFEHERMKKVLGATIAITNMAKRAGAWHFVAADSY